MFTQAKMEDVHLAHNDIEDDGASRFSEISIGCVWPNSALKFEAVKESYFGTNQEGGECSTSDAKDDNIYWHNKFLTEGMRDDIEDAFEETNMGTNEAFSEKTIDAEEKISIGNAKLEGYFGKGKVSYATKECYILRWLQINETTEYEVMEDDLTVVDAEIEAENSSEFSEIPISLVWQNQVNLAHSDIEDDFASQLSQVSLCHVWPNPGLELEEKKETAFEEVMKSEDVKDMFIVEGAESKMKTNAISYTSGEGYMSRWLYVDKQEESELMEEGPTAVETDVDVENVSEFSEIPLGLIWHNKMSKAEEDPDQVIKTIEEIL
ncbi:hypothetical protein RUND412_009533 [Rhizina undulata]